MDFNNLLLQILDEFIDGRKIDIEDYCKKYPQYREAILSKFRTAEFIKNNLREEDLSGKKLGEYIILQELGRGGMGVVFLGVQPTLSRLTAIKVLPPTFSHDKETLKNFQEEAKIVAKFNHPNIVPIYSISDERGIYYIAMGYISGLSLKSIVEILKVNKDPGKLNASVVKNILQTPLAEKQDISQKSITLKRNLNFWGIPYYKFVATIGKEIADALNYAHQNGIIHGDLKPSNILLTNEAFPMVVDFGLSRNIKTKVSSKSIEFSGTLAYAAPEQITANILDAKTDIWSLGVTLYELLTLKNPFAEKTVKKIADKILKGNPASLRSYRKNIPLELEAIVLKCLEKKPVNRYSWIQALSDDLSNYLASKPIKAKPDGILGKTRKAIKRKPITAILLFIVACLSILSFIAGLKPLTDKYFNAITYAIKEGRISEAIDLFNKCEIASKFYPYARRCRPYVAELIGDSYAAKNDTDNMKSWLYRAASLYLNEAAHDPYFLHCYRGAELLERLGHIDEADKFYRYILSRNSNSVTISKYVLFLIKNNKQADALKFLGNISKLDDSAIIIVDHTLSCLERIIEKSKYTLHPIDNLNKVRSLLSSNGFKNEFLDYLFSEYGTHLELMVRVKNADLSKLNDKDYNDFMNIEQEVDKRKENIQRQYKRSLQEIGY